MQAQFNSFLIMPSLSKIVQTYLIHSFSVRIEKGKQPEIKTLTLTRKGLLTESNQSNLSLKPDARAKVHLDIRSQLLDLTTLTEDLTLDSPLFEYGTS